MKEAGGHRLQRIPPTERRGRVHTSTVTVSVTDPGAITDITIPERDLKVEWYSGSGAGGQNRNKVQACCRLRHLPTGTVTTAQTRSRENSYRLALAEMQQRVGEMVRSQQHGDRAAIKKQQVGSGQRGDKIRTIRFQDDRAVDHRTDRKMRAADYMEGKMDQLW
jgi:peptide chain release factor 1